MTSDDDLRATIARLRGSVERNAVYGYRDLVVEDDDLTALLDAAERALQQERILDAIATANDARNAALEEAARVAEAVDPEKPTTWLHPRHKIAFAIRALKEPTHDPR